MKHIVAILANFLMLAMLAGCATTTSFLGQIASYKGVERYCNDSTPIPALKQAVLDEGNDYHDRVAWLKCIDRVDGAETLPFLVQVMHESEDLRYTALTLIADQEGSAITPILEQALQFKSAFIRGVAVGGLIERNAIDSLIPALEFKTGMYGDRTDVMDFLEKKLAHRKVAEAMAKAVNSGTEWVRRRAFAAFAEQTDHPLTMSVMCQALKGRHIEQHYMAAKGLANHLDHPVAIPCLCEHGLLNEDVKVRKVAAKALRKYKGEHPAILPAFAKYLQKYYNDKAAYDITFSLMRKHFRPALPALKTTFLGVRIDEKSDAVTWTMPWQMLNQAAESMCAIDLPAALDFFQKILNESENSFQRQVAMAFHGFGGFRQVEFLVKYLELDADPKVRIAATDGLATIGSRINHGRGGYVPYPMSRDIGGWIDYARLSEAERKQIQSLAVAALLKSAELDPDVQLDAVHALNYFGDPSAVPILERLAIQDKKPGLRAAAVAALGYSTKAVSPAMRKAVEAPDTGLRHVALKALGEIRSPEAIRLLVDRLMNDQDADNREWAATELMYTRNPKIITALRKALPGGNMDTRLLIIRTLSTHGPKAIPVLEEHLKVEVTPSVRKACTEAIEWIKSMVAMKKQHEAEAQLAAQKVSEDPDPI